MLFRLHFFSHHIFIFVVISFTYTFLHIISRSTIWTCCRFFLINSFTLVINFSPTSSSISSGGVPSDHAASFYSSIVSFLSSFFHLHLPPYHQEECHMGMLHLFTHQVFHYCHLFFQLHLPPYNQDECHLGMLPPFPDQF